MDIHQKSDDRVHSNPSSGTHPDHADRWTIHVTLGRVRPNIPVEGKGTESRSRPCPTPESTPEQALERVHSLDMMPVTVRLHHVGRARLRRGDRAIVP